MIKVQFWGVRGSVPTPGINTIRYGGDTTCIEVQAGETLIILDAGSGIRNLGLDLLKRYAGKSIEGHIFITHTHWDHIQGFPFFIPAFIPTNSFTIYGADHESMTLTEILAGQMRREYFPVPIEVMGARREVTPILEETIEVADYVKVSSIFTNHPGMTLGYRVDYNENSVVFGADHEPFNNMISDSDLTYTVNGEKLDIEKDGHEIFSERLDQKFADFAKGTDLLIMDTAYTKELYEQRKGWGHAYPEYVVKIADMAGAKQLVITHHDPLDTDHKVDEKAEHTRRVIRKANLDLKCFAAQVGYEVIID